MNHWDEFQDKRKAMQNQILSNLTDDEVRVMRAILDLEWDHIDLSKPRIRKPLREAIDRVIK